MSMSDDFRVIPTRELLRGEAHVLAESVGFRGRGFLVPTPSGRRRITPSHNGVEGCGMDWATSSRGGGESGDVEERRRGGRSE
eukprot:CAMPEP_0174885638 /NCGR_PEP_ID=MMETSP0167-20121228/896_1 /TAXON_ID=38298 /ORGANISM="Rhodella maculata, Strain CCMP736" /LENGTH=82 /DNA_ID=CAMNT_0016121277 /DNA_START=159 /DNA_END=408 /DNA_ORIENTATION=+